MRLVIVDLHVELDRTIPSPSVFALMPHSQLVARGCQIARMSSGGDLGMSFERGQGRYHCLPSWKRSSLRGFDGRCMHVLACLSETVAVVVEGREW